jgi:hypothetical protein
MYIFPSFACPAGVLLVSAIPVVGEIYWIYLTYGEFGFLNLYTIIIVLYIILWIVHLGVAYYILPDEKENAIGEDSLE